MLSKDKYFCIFGGGAIRGVSYVGAFKALKELDVEITGYAGSSAGSIAAVTAALDYDIEEVKEIFYAFDFNLFKDINFSFKIELAFSKGEIFTDKIREIIYNKLHNKKPVTFKDFPKDLYIVTSNLTTGESVIFSKETTPDFEVAQAVRISACFPGLMNPFELDGDYYVDGDLAKAYALSQLSPLLNPKDTRVLEYRLEGTKQNKNTKNPLVFVNNAFDYLSLNATDCIVKQYGNYDKYDFIVINAEDTLLFDLNLSKEKREKLCEKGYNLTKDYFKTVLKTKKQNLLKKYQDMFEVTKKSFTAYSDVKINKAKNILLEYVYENYKEFAVLDETVTEKFNNLIPLLEGESYKILFFKIKTHDYKKVNNAYKELLSDLKNKITEFENYIKNN